MPKIDFFDKLREESRQAAEYGICVSCKALFSDANTHTPDGWKETQISGLCEDCFDAACADIEERADEKPNDDEAAF